MPDVPCPVVGCTYSTGDFDNVVVAALLTAHTAGAHSMNTSVQQTYRAPKIDRPVLMDNITEESWNGFKQSWDIFVRVNGVSLEDKSVQLFSCCDSNLKAKVTAIETDILAKDFDSMLDMLKNLAVIPVAVCVKRNELLRMHQDSGELVRSFHSRVMGKAITCNFKIKCPHTHTTAGNDVLIVYTDEMIRHVILNGLYDDEIRRDIFGQQDLEKKPITELVTLIEGKETAREATTCPSVNAVSQFKRGEKAINKPITNLDQKAKCRTCGIYFKSFKKMANGKINKKPFPDCQECWRKHNPRMVNMDAEASAVSFEIGVSNSQTITTPVEHNRGDSQINELFLDHHVFEKGNWKRKVAQLHPTLKLTLSVDPNDYDGFGLNSIPKVACYELSAIIDSGAQCCLWGWQDYRAAGFTKHDLIPVKQKINAVSKSNISISGAVILRLSAVSDLGAKFTCAVIAYVSPDVSGFYLSKEAMVQLKIVNINFPSVGSVHPSCVSALESAGQSTPTKPVGQSTLKKSVGQSTIKSVVQSVVLQSFVSKSVGHGSASAIVGQQNVSEPVGQCQATEPVRLSECECPKRELPPGAPDKLPFPCVPDNVDNMKLWLFDRYKNSTLNTCPHQLLPNMDGPPVKIHLDPEAKPVASHTPAPVPLHWQDQVESDLKRDVALGVIEPVPHGEPSEWCHRMVLTRKKNGEPRRTVDLSPLNKHCKREVHAMRSPFELAKGVPENTWRTVVDAWNGFHSVPLCEEDKHLTTFITPFGRFRYLRAPQGFASSGDGYNRRFDEILSDYHRHKRCVDDVLMFDTDIEEHWWRTIELLEVLGRSGIVVNPEKFQFSQRQVDFAGFHLTETTIEPLPKYLNAITNFPVPKSLTDIRSWFGLVNQVSHYAQLRDVMEPFRKFLSPKTKFYWNQELQEKFELSKILIVDAIKEGVRIFDPKRTTCVRSDWSKIGIGFYLCQKHCDCLSRYPDCCADGWRITLCGSRFLKPSEKNYAPIEGEALAVAWSLEQTRFFTMGCDDLIVVVDHKPLTKTLGDRTLDEIVNYRIFRLKQRTLPWIFEIYWMPGKGNSFSDATSRNPVDSEEDCDADISSFALNLSSMLETDGDLIEIAAMGQLKSDLNKVKAITWDKVREETEREYGYLKDLIIGGFHIGKDAMDPEYIDFWEYRDALFVYDGVIIYGDRVIVPPSLRAEVLDTLHAAHQGVSTMVLIAQSAVFWPGITDDLQKVRNICRPCIKNAPSNPKPTPIPPVIPTTPFEAVVADYFDFKGIHYLVIADRLSGWMETYKVKTGSEMSGSSGLILLLKRFFATFGIPSELSSDGGSEFIARETENFLKRWGVYHRTSSAYNPQSNGRAELAVKSTKRLLEDNIGADGNLDTDTFVRALLMKRNTPDPSCKLSPAEIVFGRKLRDTLPRIKKNRNVFFDADINPVWREAWQDKESSLRARYQGTFNRLNEHSRALPDLLVADRVAIQNQSGSKPTKWDRTGVIIEVGDYDKYIIKVDGSGRVTRRNRKHIKKLFPDTGMFGSFPAVERPLLNYKRPELPIQHPLKEADRGDQPSCSPDISHSANKETVPVHSEQALPPVAVIAEPEVPVPPNATPVISSSPVHREFSVAEPETISPSARPTRTRRQKQFYDPSSGTYVDGNPKGR